MEELFNFFLDKKISLDLEISNIEEKVRVEAYIEDNEGIFHVRESVARTIKEALYNVKEEMIPVIESLN